MRSNSAPTGHRGGGSMRSSATANGCSRWRTTGSASRSSMPSAFFRCSSGCTSAANTTAAGSVLPSPRRSSSAMAAGSGSIQARNRVRPSTSPCRRFQEGTDDEFPRREPMTRPIRVLLVEDNPADADLTRETFDVSKLHVDLSVAIDGAQAMAVLKKRGTAPLPDLILLALNPPKKDGRAVLGEIKSDEELRKIPVVILTSSDAERDVAQSYSL